MLPEFEPNRSKKSQPSVITEAVQALTNLGYKKQQAQKTVQDVISRHGLQERIQNEDITTENLFAMALSLPAEMTSEPAPPPTESTPVTDGESVSPVASSLRAATEAMESPDSGSPNSAAVPSVGANAPTPPTATEDKFKIGDGAAYRGRDGSVKVGRVEGYRGDDRQLFIGGVDFPVRQEDAIQHKQEFKHGDEIAIHRPGFEGDGYGPITSVDGDKVSFRTPSARQLDVYASEAVTKDRLAEYEKQVPEFKRFRDPKPNPPTEKPSADMAAKSATMQPAPDPQPAPTPPTQQPEPAASESAGDEPSAVDGGLDALQSGLDVAGVVGDAAGGAGAIADGANVAISLTRAATDPKNAGKHLLNAGISAISMIPFVGDFAKAFKYGGKAAKGGAKAGKTARGASAAGDAVEAMPSNPADPGSAFDAIWDKVSGKRAAKAAGGGGSGGDEPPPGSPPGSGDGADESGGSPGSTSGDPLVDKNVRPMTDKAAEVAGTFGTVVAAGLAYAKTTELVNRQVLEYHRHISGFNGQLAQAYGELETGRMQRDMQNAQELGGSISGLAGSQNGLEESLRNFQSPFVEMGTDIQTGLTFLADGFVQIVDILDPLSEMYPLIKKWLGFSEKKDPQAKSGYFDELRKRADNMKQRRQM